MWLPRKNCSLNRFDNTELLAYCFDFIEAETEARPEALVDSCDANALDPKGQPQICLLQTVHTQPCKVNILGKVKLSL
jgi:hypothetical protein